jgi:ribulose 1,5-bisphosphate carboxylase large subunit-like protein
VLEILEETPGRAVVRLGFPLRNLNLEEAAFSSVWLYLIGGATHALLDYDASRLLSFELPPEATAHFPGPQFSLEGIRACLGAKPGELLLGTIVKPTAGLTAREVAAQCEQAARGGLRFIKDDEKMMNVDYCPLAERVCRVAEGLRRAEEETGQRCLYAPHITAGPEQLLRNAYVALENGATALMLNVFAAGFHALETLARDPHVRVPLYAHCGGKEALGRAPNQGVAPEVIAQFIRLMGGDLARVGARGGYLVGNTDGELRTLTAAFADPWPAVPAVMPAVSGGLKPDNLADNLDWFGTDCLYLAGTGITQHPGGIPGGVKAMQQVAEEWQRERKT